MVSTRKSKKMLVLLYVVSKNMVSPFEALTLRRSLGQGIATCENCEFNTRAARTVYCMHSIRLGMRFSLLGATKLAMAGGTIRTCPSRISYTMNTLRN